MTVRNTLESGLQLQKFDLHCITDGIRKHQPDPFESLLSTLF